MYKTLKRLYDNGKLTDEQLQHAVDIGWITAEEKAEIEGEYDI